MELMQTLVKRIGPKDEIILPKSALDALDVEICEEVILAIKDKGVLIRPAQSLTSKVTDSIKRDDQKRIEEIVESEEWL